MSVQENKELFRRYHDEVVEQRNLDALDDIVAKDFVDHSLPPGSEPGPESTKAMLGQLFDAFGDAQFYLEEVNGEGDRVVGRVEISGTHTGDFMGMPPSGKSFKVPSIQIVRVEKGKFAERWIWFDQAGLMQQLGAT
jgi:steroid delta-isomerase-like uncharacterized protein